jgi:hypothetical protein
MAAGFDLTATARSLLNIEVNTIVRDNMTGEPMPALPHALLDIAQSYADTLSDVGVDMPDYFKPGAPDPATTAPRWVPAPAASVGSSLTVSSDTFSRLRWAAQWALVASSPPAPRMGQAQSVLLDRIVNNSDAIKEIFKRFDPAVVQQFVGKTRAQLAADTIRADTYAVAPDDLILLQKMWDIGMEEIVAQTIVHVTGDVTTRIQSALRGAGSESLFAIHRQSIDVSVASWEYLLDAVREIAGTTVRVLLGGKA